MVTVTATVLPAWRCSTRVQHHARPAIELTAMMSSAEEHVSPFASTWTVSQAVLDRS